MTKKPARSFSTTRDRLGLSGTGELLAPLLEPDCNALDDTGKPIERLADDDIRQALLHSEPVVRRAGMRYFAGLASSDPGIAPIVIDSIHGMA